MIKNRDLRFETWNFFQYWSDWYRFWETLNPKGSLFLVSRPTTRRFKIVLQYNTTWAKTGKESTKDYPINFKHQVCSLIKILMLRVRTVVDCRCQSIAEQPAIDIDWFPISIFIDWLRLMYTYPGVSHRTKSNKFFIELNRTKSDSNRTMRFDFVRSSNEIGQQFFLWVRFPNQIERNRN